LWRKLRRQNKVVPAVIGSRAHPGRRARTGVVAAMAKKTGMAYVKLSEGPAAKVLRENAPKRANPLEAQNTR